MKLIVKDFLNYRIIVDSTPLPERYLAAKANIGFTGKNGMLIDRERGSYFFLSFILFAEPLLSEKFQPEIQPDHLISQYCGSCNLCIEACPTGALKGDGLLEASKCISTRTIENPLLNIKNAGEKKTSWIFGCDICQMVCPYNKNIEIPDNSIFDPVQVVREIAAGKIPDSDESLYGFSVKRAGTKGLKLNIQRVNANLHS